MVVWRKKKTLVVVPHQKNQSELMIDFIENLLVKLYYLFNPSMQYLF